MILLLMRMLSCHSSKDFSQQAMVLLCFDLISHSTCPASFLRGEATNA